MSNSCICHCNTSDPDGISVGLQQQNKKDQCYVGHSRLNIQVGRCFLDVKTCSVEARYDVGMHSVLQDAFHEQSSRFLLKVVISNFDHCSECFTKGKKAIELQ